MAATTHKRVQLNARSSENPHANANYLARLSHTALFCRQGKISGHLALIKVRATERQFSSSMFPLQYRLTNSFLKSVQPTSESR
jgi:hypothetical protein